MIFENMATDWCVNCEDVKEFATYVHMEFPNGHHRFGPICKDCYSVNIPRAKLLSREPTYARSRRGD